jgi:hypothetical protein
MKGLSANFRAFPIQERSSVCQASKEGPKEVGLSADCFFDEAALLDEWLGSWSAAGPLASQMIEASKLLTHGS